LNISRLYIQFFPLLLTLQKVTGSLPYLISTNTHWRVRYSFHSLSRQVARLSHRKHKHCRHAVGRKESQEICSNTYTGITAMGARKSVIVIRNGRQYLAVSPILDLGRCELRDYCYDNYTRTIIIRVFYPNYSGECTIEVNRHR